jgi:hypothetical protein
VDLATPDGTVITNTAKVTALTADPDSNNNQATASATVTNHVVGRCPLSQGFWKTHPEVWPVTSLTLGRQTYTQAELLTLLNTPPRGDASLILAHQLIAAKLNTAHGANPTPVSAAISDADNLLSGFAGKLPYHVASSSATGQAMVNDASVLDAYNNGKLTADCTP